MSKMSYTYYNSNFGNHQIPQAVNQNNGPNFPNFPVNLYQNFAPNPFFTSTTASPQQIFSNGGGIPNFISPPPGFTNHFALNNRHRNNSMGQEPNTSFSTSSTGNNHNPKNCDVGYDWQNPPNVLLYIDNSNIFESAKKYSGRKKGYLNGIPDVACRIDIGKLISTAVQGRGLVFGKLYGSEPPALDTVWEAIRRKQVHVETFQRSKWTLKEKETDSSLTADAVEDIIEQKDSAGDDRTLILFSGDRDLMRVVDKALKHDYRVEIWSFKSSINSTIKTREKKSPERVKVNSIDDIFDEITYTKVLWGKKNIPRERSLVAKLRGIPQDSDKKQFLTKFVNKAGEIFQLPMMGKYLDNYKYLVLIPCLKEHYTPQPCPSKSKSEQATTRTYDFYKHIQPFMHQLQEYFNKDCYAVDTWLKFINDQGAPKYLNILSTTRFQKLHELGNSEDNDDDSKENEDSEEIDDNDLLMSDDESEDFDCNDFFDSHHEDIEDDFIPIVRKEGKPRRMYSTYCNYNFWCSKGLDCSYKHTEQQKEFFKREPDAKRRRLYKIKLCYLKPCPHADKPYLCPYAHSLQESRCICCKEKGSGKHWMDQCPNNRYINNNAK